MRVVPYERLVPYVTRLNVKRPILFHPFSALVWRFKPHPLYSIEPSKGMVRCPRCGGDGKSGIATTYSKHWSCKLCNGAGSIPALTASEYLTLQTVDCLECDGRGEYWKGNDDWSTDWCGSCHGTGRMSQKQLINEAAQIEANHQLAVNVVLREVNIILAGYLLVAITITLEAILVGKSDGWIVALASVLVTLLLLGLLGCAGIALLIFRGAREE